MSALQDQSYELRYAAPFRLIGPAFLVLSIVFPLLIHCIDGERLTVAQLGCSLGFLAFGFACGNHYSRRVTVSPAVLSSRTWLVAREIAWPAVVQARLDPTKGEFVLQSDSGKPLRVDIHLENAPRLREDLELRFRPDTTPTAGKE